LLARVLRNEPVVAAPVVEAFVLSDPPRVEATRATSGEFHLPIVALCMSAPRALADRCLDRFDAWRKAGQLPSSDLLDAYLTGARAYAHGDLARAVRAWGPVFRVAGGSVLLPWDDLDRFNPEVGSVAEASIGNSAPSFAGVQVTAAREAKRAARKGDVKRARELAEKVIAGWRTADVEVPAVAQMQRLLRTLPSSPAQ
jgi:hypothetical protein